ncbi:Dimeric dihydrodiol dehydrogenase [Penicillium lagena]|uniref:Dimeric dihydrodiol dehydrogenase n=1 Tax=Penicillium lagena TaxID=94218 RepID=UPI0025424CB0|nr:Dimeric dihydrodiol dehydrogenase [Penicillium lagena]KAJ5618925.1 Dimeric dihydrodiol dehydrogenase [Penicillium lagena]
MVFAFIQRLWATASSPAPEKKDDALRFGLVGASNIAPMALIHPAKSHAEVVIAAVAARDRKKAETYAKKYSIPTVHDSYQDILDDPSISAVYIALPNSHHYEWALKAVKAGKHVLLEKPSTSNADEARRLFRHPLVTAADAPVLLEAFHNKFHPAFQKFLSLIHTDPRAGPVKNAYVQQYLFKGYFGADDIRFNYKLAGGCLMDFGTYTVSALRQILRSRLDPVDVTYRPIPPTKKDVGDQSKVDQMVGATYKAADGGAIGTMVADLASSGGFPAFLPASWTMNWPSFGWPKAVVECAKKELPSTDSRYKATDEQIQTVQRNVTMWNTLALMNIYHRIDVADTLELRKKTDGSLVKRWTEEKHYKIYKYRDDVDAPEEVRNRSGEDWWPTYRYMLEEFVNKVKGRPTSVWVDHEDSIDQMETLDRTYEKMGLGVRPGSDFNL